ncbi:hypothetical protein, partial [Cerasicoccus arenae]
MMCKFRFMLCLSGLLMALAANAQDKIVSIYLEPDVNGTVYFQESMDDLDDLEPRPLLDGKGAGQGWMFVQYPGKYVGYVPSSSIGPGNQVINGSKAMLRAESDSPVLAVILDGEEAEVVREENGWATIYFTGEAPAYFRLNDNSPARVAAVAPPTTVGTAP